MKHNTITASYLISKVNIDLPTQLHFAEDCTETNRTIVSITGRKLSSSRLALELFEDNIKHPTQNKL